MTKEPKTPHEEIMNCIESTNEIVSNLVEHMKNCCRFCHFRDKCEEKLSDSL